MSSQPASGYYQFTIGVTGDSRLVANHVEVTWVMLIIISMQCIIESNMQATWTVIKQKEKKSNPYLLANTKTFQVLYV